MEKVGGVLNGADIDVSAAFQLQADLEIASFYASCLVVVAWQRISVII